MKPFPVKTALRVVLAIIWIGLIPSLSLAQQNPQGRLPIGETPNPLVWVLRDSYVLELIKATDEQRLELRRLADQIDAIIWPARNRSADDVEKAWTSATEMAREQGGQILKPSQVEQIEQVILRIQGPKALRRDDFAEQIGLSEMQRTETRAMLSETAEKLADLQRRANSGEEIAPLERESQKLNQDLQRNLLAKLNETQRRAWSRALGPEINMDRLGFLDFAAPAIQSTAADWIGNAPGNFSASPVTVIHFFANGCINCQRNYEHYVKWDQTFRERGVQMIGIHTPETQEERDRRLLESRVADAKFEFPVLVDNESKNWNAWGNSMWPTVYVVDRQGRIRAWWIGELQWQGATGDRQIADKIEALLAEDAQANRR